MTKSYDASSHFETTCDDVVEIYKNVVGESFDFSKVKSEIQEAGQ